MCGTGSEALKPWQRKPWRWILCLASKSTCCKLSCLSPVVDFNVEIQVHNMLQALLDCYFSIETNNRNMLQALLSSSANSHESMLLLNSSSVLLHVSFLSGLLSGTQPSPFLSLSLYTCNTRGTLFGQSPNWDSLNKIRWLQLRETHNFELSRKTQFPLPHFKICALTQAPITNVYWVKLDIANASLEIGRNSHDSIYTI